MLCMPAFRLQMMLFFLKSKTLGNILWLKSSARPCKRAYMQTHHKHAFQPIKITYPVLIKGHLRNICAKLFSNRLGRF